MHIAPCERRGASGSAGLRPVSANAKRRCTRLRNADCSSQNAIVRSFVVKRARAHYQSSEFTGPSRTTTGSPPDRKDSPSEGGAVADGGLQYAWYAGRSCGVRLSSAGCSRAWAANRAVAVGAASAEAACHSSVARAVESWCTAPGSYPPAPCGRPALYIPPRVTMTCVASPALCAA